jgi:hypothetical protein
MTARINSDHRRASTKVPAAARRAMDVSRAPGAAFTKRTRSEYRGMACRESLIGDGAYASIRARAVRSQAVAPPDLPLHPDRPQGVPDDEALLHARRLLTGPHMHARARSQGGRSGRSRQTHTLPDGSDYRAVNPKVRALLELDDGTRLTEVNVLVQYIADQRPGKLAPVRHDRALEADGMARLHRDGSA